MDMLAYVSPTMINWGWLVIFFASALLAVVVIGIVLFAVWLTGGFRQ